MDAKKEKQRLQNLARVKKYYLAHSREIKKVGMTWPVDLLKRIDEAAMEAGMSRQAWLNATCEAALASTKRKKR